MYPSYNTYSRCSVSSMFQNRSSKYLSPVAREKCLKKSLSLPDTRTKIHIQVICILVLVSDKLRDFFKHFSRAAGLKYFELIFWNMLCTEHREV